MDLSLFFRFLLPFLSLMTAFFLVRKFRSTIRGFVMWCIPVRLRISEQSYELQTRYATLLSFLLTFLFAGLFYYGLYRGQKTLGWAIDSPVKTYGILRPLPPKPIQPPAPITPAPVAEIPETPSPAIPVVRPATPPPTKLPVSQKPIRPKPTPQPAPSQPLAAQYYIQIDAFVYLDNATNRQRKWQRKTTKLVWIAVAQESTPYKLLVGPFSTKRLANKYRKQQRAVGFVRSGIGLQFFTK